MGTMLNSKEILRRLHEIYQSPLPEGAPIRTPGNDSGLTFMFRDLQPGTAEWSRIHIPPGAERIERWGPIGAEDFGPVEVLDGRTGRHIRNVEPPRT